MIGLFLTYAGTGNRLNGQPNTLPTLNAQNLSQTWFTQGTLPVASNNLHGSVNDLVLDAFGSRANLAPFLPLRDDINRMKGTIYANIEPINIPEWEKVVRKSEDDHDQNGAYTRVHNILHEVRKFSAVDDCQERQAPQVTW